MLESTQHEFAWFITLTYDEKHYPVNGSLEPKVLQKFWKRLRECSGDKIKYFAVGEYGDVTKRAHYHAIVFGLRDSSHIAKCWKLGFVHIGFVSPQSCNYITSYAVKGMTRREDERLHGRYPEFARMSLRPHGLAHGACGEIARVLHSSGGAASIQKTGDIPAQLRWLQERWPLGRYLRRVVRSLVGMEPGQPVGVRCIELELQALYGSVVKQTTSGSYSFKGHL